MNSLETLEKCIFYALMEKSQRFPKINHNFPALDFTQEIRPKKTYYLFRDGDKAWM